MYTKYVLSMYTKFGKYMYTQLRKFQPFLHLCTFMCSRLHMLIVT